MILAVRLLGSNLTFATPQLCDLELDELAMSTKQYV